MRRISTCLAVLGLAVIGPVGLGVGGADDHAQSGGRADPRLPAHGQHPRRGRRAADRIHDLGDRIRRLPAAADRGQVLLAPQARDCTRRASPPARRAVIETKGPSACPKASQAGPKGEAQRHRQLRHRTRAERVRRCSRSSPPAAVWRSSPTASRRSRSKSSRRAKCSTPRRRSARRSKPKCR